MVRYNISKDGRVLTIYESYKTPKKEMYSILDKIRFDEGMKPIFERSNFSLKCEWIFHNFLYNIGILRDRTKDADLDNPCDRPEWVYKVCGILVWLFVK